MVSEVGNSKRRFLNDRRGFYTKCGLLNYLLNAMKLVV